jgi:probable rRNA maturation factor
MSDRGTVVDVTDQRVDPLPDQSIDPDRWAALAAEVADRELDAETRRPRISLVFVDEDEMARLNGDHRGVDGSTDVLSFPIDADPPTDSGLSGPAWMLGDIAICPAVAARNAPDHAGTYVDELALLVVHGVLHLLGMDHLDDVEADEMEAREQLHLGRLR